MSLKVIHGDGVTMPANPPSSPPPSLYGVLMNDGSLLAQLPPAEAL